MVGVGRLLSRWWLRLCSASVKAAAFAYSNPDVAVLLVTMFAGILLSTGMDFISRVFSDDEVRRPGTSQLVGLFFVLSGMMSFWTAWSAQQFRTDLTRGRESFGSWRGAGAATLALFLAIACFAVAVTLLLTFAALKEPATTAPQYAAGCDSLPTTLPLSGGSNAEPGAGP